MKTKILFSAILIVCAINISFSQDRIVRKDNFELQVKVLKISNDSIWYVPFDSPYSFPKTIPTLEVAKIMYEDGHVDNFISVKPTVPVNNQPYVVPPVEIPSGNNSSQGQQISVSHYASSGVLYGRIGLQMWDDNNLSEFFGNNAIVGAGIACSLGNYIRIGGNFDFATKTKDETTCNYTQVGGFVGWSWNGFANNFTVYNELGFKGLFLKSIDKSDNYSEALKGVGVSLLLGLEIKLSENMLFDLSWDSVFGKVHYEDEYLNVHSEIVYVGLKFMF